MLFNKSPLIISLMLAPISPLLACSVDVSSGVNFGTYNPFNSTPNQSTTQIEVTCTVTDTGSFSLTLDTGSSGTFTNRTLISSDFTMNYNLYTSATYATVWGDGSSGTSFITDDVSNCVSSSCQYTIYGQAPSSQLSVGVGSYVDTVNATLTF
jgi:spore coat protein U-like protein